MKASRRKGDSQGENGMCEGYGQVDRPNGPC